MNIGYRENPCPADGQSLEEGIQQQLESFDESTVAAFIEFCGDRIEDFLEHEARVRREHAEEIRREAA